jgi:hypothetical protein
MFKDRYSRQSFLGERSQEIIQEAVIGVIGLGGGGSHIVQQLGHVGFLNYILFDPQNVDNSNLNRMVSATEADVENGVLKTAIAQRAILGLQPKAKIQAVTKRWQENPELLRGCDIIFGCVDTFQERDELETCARRYLIPYIDIGMDVFQSLKGQPPRMVGQVILSMPGNPCMKCFGFIDQAKLAIEASKYGAAGHRPQVVWSNGILASSAVGIAIDILTGWNTVRNRLIYLSYDGNQLTLTPHVRLNQKLPEVCEHYPSVLVGDPVFKKL